VDLSDRSVPALKRALHLAHLHGGKLLVVHVTDPRSVSGQPAQQDLEGAFFALRRFTHEAPYQTVPVRWIIARGNPAIEVARLIRWTNADLAVVGGALPRPATGVVGTIAHAILRTTGCPVLVIPRTLDAGASPKAYRELLCGVSSGLSSGTLRYALSFAQEFESRLTILNVEDSNRVHGTNDGWVPIDIDRLRAEIPESARDWSVIDERKASGEPARELVKAAQELDADLIVVGSTAAPGSDGGLGSVALGALTLTDASVLIVPTSGVAREIDLPLAA
jgi:nucleotide-binding universal stress UspA family protein